MGLLGGPTVTSFISGYYNTAETNTGEEPPIVGMAAARMMAFLSLWLATIMAAALPTNKDFGADALVLEDGRTPYWRLDGKMSAEKWTAALVSCTSTIVRLLMRLLWEASAVLVLAAHFCLGHVYSGYGATSVICIYLLAQCLFVHLVRRLHVSDHSLVQVCEVCEVCGLFLMLRKPQDAQTTEQEDVMQSTSSLVNVLTFLVGSSLFYAGNCLTSAPLNSWGTKCGPREGCVLFYTHLAVQIGVCLGACLARLFSGSDPHQNTLVALLLPMVLAQVCLSEIGLGNTGEDSGKDEQTIPKSVET